MDAIDQARPNGILGSDVTVDFAALALPSRLREVADKLRSIGCAFGISFTAEGTPYWAAHASSEPSGLLVSVDMDLLCLALAGDATRFAANISQFIRHEANAYEEGLQQRIEAGFKGWRA